MGDFIADSETSLTALYDQCQLLQNVMHDVLRLEVGERLDKANKFLSISKAAVDLEQAGDEEASGLLMQRLRSKLEALSDEEAVFVTRMCGHYLNLTAIAEQQHMVRCSLEPGHQFSLEPTFTRLQRKGFSPKQIYDAVCNQRVEIVLTAHPTQVVRRSLQYKQYRVGQLLHDIEAAAAAPHRVDRDEAMRSLFREVMAMWQTDELRRKKPTPVDEAKGGLHIVEQSLWNAVPAYLRHLNAQVHALCGQELPITCTPIRFSSWMGGDRDGNPNVTARVAGPNMQVTQRVALLSRWMAVDLYLRDIEMLTFELSMNRCSDALWTEAEAIRARIAEERDTRRDRHNKLPADLVIAPSHLTDGDQPLQTVVSVDSPPAASPQAMSPHMSARNSSADLAKSPPDGSGVPTPPRVLSAAKKPSIGLARRSGRLMYKKGTPQDDWSHRVQHDAAETAPMPSSYPLAPADADDGPAESAGGGDAAEGPDGVGKPKGAHKGFHPYRDVLGDVRRKLQNTKARMETLLAGRKPDDDLDWLDSEDELARTLQLCYWSLWECGAGMIAQGRLLDILRRLYTFGLSLLKMDLRQESTRHTELLSAICQHLGYGDYAAWDEATKCEWLKKELNSKRPLIPPACRLPEGLAEVQDTFRVAADLGPRSLGAYVISMASHPSDVLAVVLLQKEARLQAALDNNVQPDMRGVLRVAPLFETLDDLDGAAAAMDALFADPWYRAHLRDTFDNQQEVMLGYSDSGKDAGRLAANWALYRCQEQLVEVAAKHGVVLTLFHGRGGSIGRGGGPMNVAINSQPAGSIQNRLRVTEQGEMIHAKFGAPELARTTIEGYTTAVLEATLSPPAPPKDSSWRDIMDRLSAISCDAYRDMVFRNPTFLQYFRTATPEAELGNLNIGSRPTRRKAADAGVSSLRAIPWIFAWTQTRHILPSWLGVGEALSQVLQNDKAALKAMYRQWPFFQATIDLIEMTLAKADMAVARIYDEVLVKDDNVKAIGRVIEDKYGLATSSIKSVTGHAILCANSSMLRSLLAMRKPYTDPCNFLQVEILRRMREQPEKEELRESLLLTINGIAAGMRNTG